jgi:hypothetical protein
VRSSVADNRVWAAALTAAQRPLSRQAARICSVSGTCGGKGRVLGLRAGHAESSFERTLTSQTLYRCLPGAHTMDLLRRAPWLVSSYQLLSTCTTSSSRPRARLPGRAHAPRFTAVASRRLQSGAQGAAADWSCHAPMPLASGFLCCHRQLRASGRHRLLLAGLHGRHLLAQHLVDHHHLAALLAHGLRKGRRRRRRGG